MSTPNPLQEPHPFLSIAVEMQKIQPEQAFRVIQLQLTQADSKAKKVGEIAVKHRFMRARDVDVVLSEQQERRTNSTHYSHDVIKEYQRKYWKLESLDADKATKFRVLSGLAMLPFLAAVWVKTRNWSDVATLSTIYAFTQTLAETLLAFAWKRDLAPERRIALNRLPERLLPFFAVTLFCYALRFSPGVSWGFLSPLGLLFFLVYCGGLWRYRRIQFFRARSDLMRDLVDQTHSAAFSFASTTSSDQKLRIIQDLLDNAAVVLQVNPYAQITMRIMWVFRLLRERLVPVSIWFHEKDPADGSRLMIKAFAAPGAELSTLKVLEEIRAHYHAKLHDDVWFQKVRAEHTLVDSTRLDVTAIRAKFGQQIPSSLAGWVYHHRACLDSNTTAGSLVFDPSFRELVPAQNRNDPWLHPTAYLGCPILDPHRPESEPLGVLIVHRHGSKAIRAEDSNTIETLADLMGFLMTKGLHDEQKLATRL